MDGPSHCSDVQCFPWLITHLHSSLQGPFDITRKLFSSQEGTLSLQDRSNLFFEDYSFIPLFVQENYITARPDNIRWASRHTLLRQCLASM